MNMDYVVTLQTKNGTYDMGSLCVFRTFLFQIAVGVQFWGFETNQVVVKVLPRIYAVVW